MFNGNGKISSNQMYKCFFCTSVCPALFLFLYDYVSLTDFILSFISTLVFSLILLALTKFINPRAKGICVFFNLLFIVKYLLMIYLDLSIIFFTLYNCFGIPATKPLFLLVIFVLCLYIAKSGVEKIFRLSEILFIILIIPVIILLFTPVFRVNASNIHYFTAYLYQPFTSKNSIFRSLIIAIIIFPAEICNTFKNYFLVGKNYTSSILKSLITIFSIVLAAALIIIGIYGNISNKYTVHPLFSLMQIMPIGESLSVRLDFIVYIFIFASLLYSIGFYLYAINHSIKKIFKNMTYGIFAFPLLSLIFIYLIFTSYKSANPLHHRESNPAMVENIYIKQDNIVFEIQQYSDDNTFFNTYTENIYNANAIYSQAFNNYLDFSHINAIYVSENIYNDNTSLQNTLLQFKKQLIFPETLKIKTENRTGYKYLYTIYMLKP